jgi:hypothetical protein
MVSYKGTSFAADMGYLGKNGRCLPGVSVFQRRGSTIVRISDVGAEPLDDLCVLWHLLELLPAGDRGFVPKLAYKNASR